MVLLNGIKVVENNVIPDGNVMSHAGTVYLSNLDYRALEWTLAHHEVIRQIRAMFADARKQLLNTSGSSNGN